jgi:hypothetical protein
LDYKFQASLRDIARLSQNCCPPHPPRKKKTKTTDTAVSRTSRELSNELLSISHCKAGPDKPFFLMKTENTGSKCEHQDSVDCAAIPVSRMALGAG